MASEERKAYMRKYYAEHRAERLEYQRNYYLTHKEECKARAYDYYLKHPEKMKQWAKESRQRTMARDPERYRAYYRNRYETKIKNNPEAMEKHRRIVRRRYWSQKFDKMLENPKYIYIPFEDLTCAQREALSTIFLPGEDIDSAVNNLEKHGLSLVGMDGRWYIEMEVA